MTQFDSNWARDHEAQRKWLTGTGMYDESEGRASCGVGLRNLKFEEAAVAE